METVSFILGSSERFCARQITWSANPRNKWLMVTDGKEGKCKGRKEAVLSITRFDGLFSIREFTAERSLLQSLGDRKKPIRFTSWVLFSILQISESSAIFYLRGPIGLMKLITTRHGVWASSRGAENSALDVRANRLRGSECLLRLRSANAKALFDASVASATRLRVEPVRWSHVHSSAASRGSASMFVIIRPSPHRSPLASKQLCS
jgi:hypothetical protein